MNCARLFVSDASLALAVTARTPPTKEPSNPHRPVDMLIPLRIEVGHNSSSRHGVGQPNTRSMAACRTARQHVVPATIEAKTPMVETEKAVGE